MHPWSSHRGVRKLLKYALAALILFFLFRLFRDDIARLGVESVRFSAPHLVASYLLAAVYYVLNAWSWHRLTRALGVALPFGKSVEIWLYSQLGKYLPGRFWLVLGRLHAYREKGMPRRLVGTAFVMEMTLRLLAGIFLFSITWGLVRGIEQGFLGLTAATAAGLLLLLHPRVLQGVMNRALSLLKREPVRFRLRLGDLLSVFALETAAWAVGGAGLWMVVTPSTSLTIEDLPLLAGAAAVSGVLGTLAVFVPSGLGVREGVLASLLSTLLPTSAAVLATVVARLWITSAELLLIGVVFAAAWATGRGSRTSPGPSP